MADLQPTPELIATARQVRDDLVWAAHDEPPAKDPQIATLLGAGYVRLHFTPAYLRVGDYWRLTSEGWTWLDRHDKGGA